MQDDSPVLRTIVTLEDSFREACDFLAVPFALAWKKYRRLVRRYPAAHLVWTKETEREWLRKVNSSSYRDVEAFYAETNNLVFELIEYHSTGGKQRLTEDWIELTKQEGLEKVLDYGCGIGQDSIRATEEGLSAMGVDIVGRTLEFAMWRAARRGLDIEFSSIETLPRPSMFDGVTCFEVLQHVTDQKSMLLHIARSLKVGGLLFVTARFVGNYALALVQYESIEIQPLVEKFGFELESTRDQWPGKQLYVFRRVEGGVANV